MSIGPNLMFLLLMGAGMNKTYVILGISVLFLALSASAEIDILPQNQNACCESVLYEVTLTNELRTAQVFDLSVDSLREIKITLEPDTIKLASGETETLVMMARPDCGMVPGVYEITVTSQYTGACEDICGEYCEFTEEDSTLLTIPNGCIVPEPEPEPVEQPEQNQTETNDTNQTETPTGAVVSADNDYIAIGVLFVLLGIFIIMLALIRRDANQTKGKRGEKK